MDSFKVGSAPWETGEPQTFPVGKAPWEMDTPAPAKKQSFSESIFSGLASAGSSVGRFLGIEKFGQGFYAAGSNIFGGTDELESLSKRRLDDETKLVGILKDPKTTPEQKTRVQAILANNKDYAGEAAADISTAGGMTSGEFGGSVLSLLTTVLGAGSLAAKGGSSFALSKGASTAKTLAQSTGLSGGYLKAAQTGLQAAEGATLGYGFDVGSNLQEGSESPFMPGFGTAIGAGLPIATAIVGSIVKHTAGFSSQTGTEAIQRAFNDPDTVTNAIRTYAKSPEQQQELVKQANQAIQAHLSQRSDEYGSALTDLAGGATKETVEKGKSILDSFKATFADKIKTFGGQVAQEGKNAGNLTFKNSTLTSADQEALKGAWKQLGAWDDTTLGGLDNLRQAVGNYIDDFKLAGNSRANVALSGVEKSLKESIEGAYKGYRDVLSKYGFDTRVAKSLAKELSQSGNAKDSTKLNQILRLFKKDESVMKNLVEVMGKEEAERFLDEVSGAILAKWVPPGILGNFLHGALQAGGAGAAFLAGGSPAGLGAAAFGAASMSPRVVGETAQLLGRGARAGVGTGAQRATTLGASKL